MRSQRCTQCGTRLDVSRMEKGAKFACSNCGSVLEVGEVEVTKRSLADSGSQFERKSSDDAVPKKSSRAKSDGSRTTGRGRGTTSASSTSTGKSSKPLVLGGVGVAVAVVVIVLSMGGGDEGAGGGLTGGGSGKTSGAVAWWDATQGDVATMSAADLRASIREAKDRGFDENDAFWDPKADLLFKALLKHVPADKAANLHFGRVDLRSYDGFGPLWDAMEKHVARLPEEYARFYEKHLNGLEGGKRVYLSSEDFEAASAVLESFAAWNKKMEADPSPRLIDKGISRVAARTPGYGVVAAVQLPVIVFLASKELGAKVEKSVRDAKTADLSGRVVAVQNRAKSVLEAWNEQIVKPLALKPLPRDQAIYSYVFDNREKFDEISKSGRGTALDAGTPLLFSYRLSDQMSFGLMPSTPDEDKWFTSDLGHILAHQLHKAYSKNPKDKYGTPFKEQNAIWFVEGLAEYIGAGSRDGGKFSGVSPKRAAFLKRMDEAGVPMFEVREIVRMVSLPRYGRYFRETWRSEFRAEENQPETATAMVNERGFAWKAFQSQCWYLTYFMATFKNGKYKAQFHELTQTMLQGRQMPEKYGTGKFRTSEDAFAQIFGLKTDKDWERLLDEYDGYLPGAIGAPK